MLSIAGTQFNSRLILGSALYPSPDIMQQSIRAAEVELITIAVRRQSPEKQAGKIFWDYIKDLDCQLLPNTAGCFSAKEAVTTAQMAAEIFNTKRVKLEVIGDDYTLQPNPFELVNAAKQLIALGFEVWPYCTDDLVLCQTLLQLGCPVLMPWGAPIGSGQGLLNTYALKNLRKRLPDVPLIIDAGIGLPSHACQALEMGFDAVLLNSAVALAQDPVQMAVAFKQAVNSGRIAYESGPMLKRDMANPSTPELNKPFWLQETDGVKS